MKRLSRVFVFALALAVSGVVHANWAGHKWSFLPVPYKIYTQPGGVNGVSGTFATAVRPVIVSAFRRWTTPSVSCTKWNSTDTGDFSTPSGLAAVNPGDGTHRVIFLGGADWKYGSSTLGVTNITYDPQTGEIFGADMEMNNNIPWKVSGGVSNPNYDVESVVTHEAGHFLGLEHSPNSAAIMYAYYSPPDIKTTLWTSDTNDVCSAYPATGAAGGQGSFCQTNSNCLSAQGLVCAGAQGQTASKICTRACSTTIDCPQGYECLASDPAGTTGKACLLPVGSPDLCKFCTKSSDCSNGQCVWGGNGEVSWCTMPCQSSSSCGTGFTCQSSQTGSLCVPNNLQCPAGKAQCTSNAGCPVGYTCTGGMCLANGNPGDRCDTSYYCKPCSVCIGSSGSTEAYCLACCPGGTNYCTGCSVACTGGTCVGLQGGADSVCEPTTPKACQPCDAQAKCSAGLTCYAGRCYATCNPAAPGTCPACFNTGGGGVCACSDQIANEGQPCGPQAGGSFIACRSGSTCVGSPGVCRTPCTPGNNSTCPSGMVCGQIAGTPYCVPGNVPGARCGPCANGNDCGGLTCYQGRCYTPCQVDQPTCMGCIKTSGTDGICACEDQLSGVGGPCGPDGGVVYICSSPWICANGACRQSCNPTLKNCNVGQSCQPYGSTNVCAPGTILDAGTGTEADSGLPDAGSQVAQAPTCCSMSSGAGKWPFLWLALVIAMWPRRRRAVPSSPGSG